MKKYFLQILSLLLIFSMTGCLEIKDISNLVSLKIENIEGDWEYDYEMSSKLAGPNPITDKPPVPGGIGSGYHVKMIKLTPNSCLSGTECIGYRFYSFGATENSLVGEGGGGHVQFFKIGEYKIARFNSGQIGKIDLKNNQAILSIPQLNQDLLKTKFPDYLDLFVGQDILRINKVDIKEKNFIINLMNTPEAWVVHSVYKKVK